MVKFDVFEEGGDGNIKHVGLLFNIRPIEEDEVAGGVVVMPEAVGIAFKYTERFGVAVGVKAVGKRAKEGFVDSKVKILIFDSERDGDGSHKTS